MSEWGAKEFQLTGLNFGKSYAGALEQAVSLLPARVKQAFYGAAMRKGVIARKTWNGCAFNAGSLEQEVLGEKAMVGDGVQSTNTAAAVFGISPYKVTRFIEAWDRSPYPNDEEATKALLEIIERLGMFSEPDSPEVKVITHRRVVTQLVFEGTLTDAQLLAEFKTELENPEFSFPELAAVEELIGV